MSEMVERVAAAVWSQHTGASDFTVDTYDHDEEQRDWWRGVARVAIEAMREPTAQMLACRVSLPWDREDQSHYLDSDAIGELWDDMIDAALTPTLPEQ